MRPRRAGQWFRVAFNHLKFTEIDGFNLGYSNSLGGSGIGLKHKCILLRATQELVDLDIDDPEVFCLLPFLQEGIGCDRISDIFISINHAAFLRFTERQLDELGVGGRSQHCEYGESFNLVISSGYKRPLILIPKQFTKNLPTSRTWADTRDVYNENSALRHRLNSLILKHLATKRRGEITKSDIPNLLPEIILELLKSIISEFKATPSFTQVERDLIDEVEAEISATKAPAITALKDQVLFILNKFVWFVEKKSVWRAFYGRDDDGLQQPLSEEHVQLSFRIVAERFADRFDIGFIPEADTGVGRVDFMFSKGHLTVLVEMKLSTHKRLLHGYETQLAEYIDAMKPQYSFYLAVRMKAQPATEDKICEGRVARLKDAAKVAKNDRRVIYVNARPRPSASVS